MRLYSGTSKQFIQDAIHNQIAEKLKNAFFGYYRYNPSPSEINSWRNSLRSISQVFQHADLLDHGVLLEYPPAKEPTLPNAHNSPCRKQQCGMNGFD